MKGLEKINGLKEVEIPVEKIEGLVIHKKFATLCKLSMKLFEETDFFYIDNLFIDLYKNKKPCVFIHLQNSSLDVFDKDYVSESKKSIEVFKKEYLKPAKKLIKQYKREYKEKIELKDST